MKKRNVTLFSAVFHSVVFCSRTLILAGIRKIHMRNSILVSGIVVSFCGNVICCEKMSENLI
jgi:hypothetical protein